MEIDRELIEDAKKIENIARFGVRTLDVLLIPTSFTRTVMRAEDNYLGTKRWEESFFKGRYRSNSKERWVFPLVYSAAGVLETARLAAFGYVLWNLIN